LKPTHHLLARYGGLAVVGYTQSAFGLSLAFVLPTEVK
jgi:hypothetical protein